MNQITQHYPDFCEGFERHIVPFETVEELLDIDWVKSFSAHRHFHQYAIGDECLMAIYRGGREWWVIGRIKDPASVDLPKWDGGLYEVVDEAGKVTDIPGNLVAWSCGDAVRLKDGTVHSRYRPSEMR